MEISEVKTSSEATQSKRTLGSSAVRAAPQEPPRYYGYWRYKNGGFSDVTRCTRCGNVGLYEDCHPVNSCKHCGGIVVEDGAAKWVAPTYSGFLWWRKEKTAGYWMRA